MKYTRISQLDIAVFTLEDALRQFTQWIERNERRYVSTCVAYNFVLAHEYQTILEAMQKADACVADGMPLVWVQKWMGHPDAERIYGPDVLRAMCKAGSSKGISHFFFGGREATTTQLIQNLVTEDPKLRVAGRLSPEYHPALPVQVDPATVEYINKTCPDVVWVGLGAPLQDLWMAAYRPHLDAPLLIGVGAAFDFVAGTKPQAPRWMQANGLEWFFRLQSEPRRLWRRYLVYGPRFVSIILRWYLRYKP